MSVPYRQLARMSAQRVGAVIGATAAAKITGYNTTPLTATQIGNIDFILPYIQDLMVAVVGEIIAAYASAHNHPWRSNNAGVTANIAHKAIVPAVSSAGKPIVGVYGAIKDAVTGNPLTKMPLRVVESIVSNQDTFLKGSYFHYDLVGERLYHTVANAVIDVVVYSATDQLTAIAANGDVPLPDAALLAAVDGMSSRMIADDDYMNQAQMFNQHYQDALQIFRTGGVAYTPAPIDQVTMTPAAA